MSRWSSVRQVDVLAWLWVGVGVVWTLGSGVGAVAGQASGLDVTGPVAIVIGWGLLRRRDGFRLVALGAAFLSMIMATMSVLFLLGSSPPSAAWFAQEAAFRDGPSWWVVSGLWTLAGLIGGWMAWVLTRSSVLAAFGNAVDAQTEPPHQVASAVRDR